MRAFSEYQRRGFKHLMVSFGCTGGQHRSVYLAEQLAKRLREQRRRRRAAPPRTGEQGRMKAMVLAAGLGTRLRPLTNDRPKALVEIAGRTLLEITLERLRTFGIHEVIINVHHFADKVVDYPASPSRLRHADRDFARRRSARHRRRAEESRVVLSRRTLSRSDEPFLLHNVDVISTIDLRRMAEVHAQRNRRSRRWRCRTARPLATCCSIRR